MFGFYREYRGALIKSVGLHLVLFGLLSLSLARGAAFTPPPPQITIKATVVDEQRIQQEIAALEEAEQEVQRQADAKLEEARRQRQQEERRTKAAEDKRRQDLLSEQKRAAADKRRRDEAEARSARELKVLEEKRSAEQIRLARIREEQEEAEKARQRAQAETDARIQAQIETDLQAELDLEQSRLNAEEAGLLDLYKAMIEQKVRRNWIRPPSAGAGVECTVNISQIPGGEVIDVRIAECNADEVTRRSIEAAVFKASPLPEPPDPNLFERNIIFNFKPEN
ncbi:MAG: cell envelope integrity protein TolA [Gammaproteobacteria bacterium]|nr:cell envelope integrity protein TolA [Gammaproteobacteria bacterium]